MYPSDQIYHAERPKTRAEQREADRVSAEFAAAASGLWRACAAPWRALRRALRAGRRGQPPARPHQQQPLDRTDTVPCLTRDEHAEMCCSAR